MGFTFKVKKTEWSLVGLAFIFSFLFLFAEWQLPATHQEKIGTGHAWLGQAYNFYKYGVSNVVGNTIVRIKDFNLYDKEVSASEFNIVSIYDPIFYSIFCAWFWKLLGAPSLWFLKLLNIIIFSLLMIWLFRVLELLFEDKKKALMGAFGVLLFFPLLYTNISIPRDAHHYYAFIIFLYFILTFVISEKKISFLIPGALLFVFCQWARPCILSSFVILTGLFLLWGFIESSYREKFIKSLSVFWIISFLFFWIPFLIFNKITYDKYYVIPQGEALLGSLYGAPFPDGDAVEHTTGKFVLRKTGHYMKCGSIESDNICMSLYKEYVLKYPYHRLKCMFIRLKTMLWYDLPWRQYDPYLVTTQTSRWFKLKLALTSPKLFLEFFARLYMRILLVLGYLGILIAFWRKEYKLLIFMIIGVVFSSGYSWLFHIEDRILAVHNWPFGIFAAYFLSYCYESLRLFIKNKYKMQNFNFFITH